MEAQRRGNWTLAVHWGDTWARWAMQLNLPEAIGKALRTRGHSNSSWAGQGRRLLPQKESVFKSRYPPTATTH